jgi:DNA-binding response OmpR family regulator
MKVILVVEDDPGIGESLVEAIAQETSYKPFLATNARQAFMLASILKPNLLLLDYKLPDANGIELFDRLRANIYLAAIPALILSGNIPYWEAQKRQLSYLRKPFHLDDLIRAIDKHIA